jgi:hypothetical protein
MSAIAIFTNAPIWVWPLLGILITLGYVASRERTTLIAPLYFLPLFGILSFNAVNGLPAHYLVWVIFALAYGLGVWRGYIFQDGIVLFKSKTHAKLSGEWLTMAVVMVVFWMNFIGGAARAISPTLYQAPMFHFIFATIAGLGAGVFLGRALLLAITPSEAEI